MLVRDYFVKNIMYDIVIGNDAKIKGSFSRGPKYITDIDVSCTIKEPNYNKLINIITQKHKDVIFLYVTLFYDPFKNIDMHITKKNDFRNIDFIGMEKELTKMHDKNIITTELYDKLISYIHNKTLENMLKLELEINIKPKIKWFLDDINKDYKIINGVKYNFKEMYEIKDNGYNIACVIHWFWNMKQYPVGKFLDLKNNNTFFFIDNGAVYEHKHHTYFRQKMEEDKYFFKDMFILYYEKDYYYLLKALMHITKHNKQKYISKEIQHLLEHEYGLHKQIINKLHELNKLYSDEFKNIIDINIIDKAFETVKNNMAELKCDYDEKLTIVENRQKIMNILNDQIKPNYNKFREMLIKNDSRFEFKMPDALK
jgi:hypothetical protein